MNAIVEKANLSRVAALRKKSVVENALDMPVAVTFPAQTLLPDLRIPIAALAVIWSMWFRNPHLKMMTIRLYRRFV